MSQNVVLIRFSQDGSTISFFITFGGTSTDIAADMDFYGNNIYFCGYGQELGGNPSVDAFVVSVVKSSGSTNWVRRLGSSSVEMSYGLAIHPLNGNVIVLATTNDV